MKKVLYLLILLVLPCVVQAQDKFYLEWENDEVLIADEERGALDEDGYLEPYVSIRENNYEYNHGYITSMIEVDPKKSTMEMITTLNYSNKDGEVLISKEFTNNIFISFTTNGDKLYAAVVELENDTTVYKVVEINTSLEIVKQYDLTKILEKEFTDEEGNVDSDDMSSVLLIPILLKAIGWEGINFVDGEIVILLPNTGFLLVKEDMSSSRIIEFTEENMSKYFYELYVASLNISEFMEMMNEKEWPTNDILYLFNEKHNNNVASGGLRMNYNTKLDLEHGFVIQNETTNEEGVTEYQYIELDATLALADANGKLLWEKVNKDYMLFYNTKFINGYIVTLGLNVDVSDSFYDKLLDGASMGELVMPNLDFSFDNVASMMAGRYAPTSEKANSDILIYDMNGELVQKISNDGIYLGLYASEAGFITTNVNDLFAESGIMGSRLAVYPSMQNEVWHLNNQIETKVNGKGTIVVNNSSRAGDMVEFEVKPEKGYVLSAVKVTDKEGNVLVFTDYKFTMPSADVLIEVIFLPENPGTSDFFNILIILVFISVGAWALHKYKEYKWLG